MKICRSSLLTDKGEYNYMNEEHAAITQQTPVAASTGSDTGNLPVPLEQAANLNEARRAVAAARRHPGPAFIDFRIVQEGEEGNVYPMVPGGVALHEMIRRPIST